MKLCPTLVKKTNLSLRDLIKNREFLANGSSQSRSAIQRFKADTVSKQVVALYHTEKKTTVSSDASRFGLGTVLKQKQPSGEIKPVACASR